MGNPTLTESYEFFIASNNVFPNTLTIPTDNTAIGIWIYIYGYPFSKISYVQFDFDYESPAVYNKGRLRGSLLVGASPLRKPAFVGTGFTGASCAASTSACPTFAQGFGAVSSKAPGVVLTQPCTASSRPIGIQSASSSFPHLSSNPYANLYLNGITSYAYLAAISNGKLSFVHLVFHFDQVVGVLEGGNLISIAGEGTTLSVASCRFNPC